MLTLLVTAFSGCGTKESNSPNNNQESTSVVSSEKQEKKKANQQAHQHQVKKHTVNM